MLIKFPGHATMYFKWNKVRLLLQSTRQHGCGHKICRAEVGSTYCQVTCWNHFLERSGDRMCWKDYYAFPPKSSYQKRSIFIISLYQKLERTMLGIACVRVKFHPFPQSKGSALHLVFMAVSCGGKQMSFWVRQTWTETCALQWQLR